jgi:hypothetical protein
MFVLPSLIGGFIASYPTLVKINGLLFTPDMGIDIAPLPTKFAVS